MKNTVGVGHGRILAALAEGSRGVELKDEFAIALRGLLIKLSIVAEVGPGLGALGRAENTCDMKVSRA